ncbi:hypothetical protein FOMPIDRAFT_1120778, partial [Fomitopsis schrenkii]
DVIPSMDLIDEHLATDTTNLQLDPAIRVAVGCAKRTINHYYDKSDESAAYRIAMILDPRYKLQYFSDNGWLESWIDDARLAVEQTFNEDWKGREWSTGSETEKQVHSTS